MEPAHVLSKASSTVADSTASAGGASGSPGASAAAGAAGSGTGSHVALLKLDAGGVVRAARGGSVEAEADDEDAVVHAELDGVASAAIPPLVASIGRGLEAVAHL